MEYNLLALAFLFVLIVSLLCVALCLFQRCFEMYRNMYNAPIEQRGALQHLFNLQKNEIEIHKTEREIITIINERLLDMEQMFPSGHPQEELSEMLIENLKKVLQSTLNLLKTERHEN